MNQIAKSLFFNLISFAVNDIPLPNGTKERIGKDELRALYKLSSYFDLEYLIGDALVKSGLVQSQQLPEDFQKQMYVSVLRYQRSDYELGRIHQVLEESGIDHILLKGAVIRNYYPDPAMRNSCDIDVLVRERDLDNTVKILIEKLEYSQVGEKHYHDISLVSKSKVHLELHFSIHENMKKADALLDKVWESTAAVQGSQHCYNMTPEFFMFHHIAHMTYHFINGGCGIKPFVDLLILKENLQFNNNVLNNILKKSGLNKFYNSVERLCAVWFENLEHTKITEQMEEYILLGGKFGTYENRIAVRQQLKGGRTGYIFSRIFLPFDVLKSHYPVLKKHCWLTPLMHIKRWFKLLSADYRNQTVKELKNSASITKTQAEFLKEMLRNLGL